MPDVPKLLEQQLARRILVLDGAIGTMVERLHLSEAAFRGERFRYVARALKGDNDLLAITEPDIITGLHHDYLAAGSDIVTTNTFNSTAVSQARYGLESIVYELNVAASRLAKRACADWSTRTPDKPRFVAGSIGPTSQPLMASPGVDPAASRSVAFEALKDAYLEQLRGLIEGGCDLLLVETIVDTLNAEAVIVALEAVYQERRHAGDRRRLPLMLSVTISKEHGRMLSGQPLEDFWKSVAHASPLSVGINCGFGARAMRANVAALAQIADCLISCHPSAGLPDVLGGYDEQPEDTARVLGEIASRGLVNIVGGCCGTTPEHIRAIAAAVEDLTPRRR
jgi:5-methyltetrahydrofolate--homocysteine methyltransferase